MNDPHFNPQSNAGTPEFSTVRGRQEKGTGPSFQIASYESRRLAKKWTSPQPPCERLRPRERTCYQVRKFLDRQGGLAAAMVATGLLCIPILGWTPLIAVAVAIAASAYIDKSTRRR